MTDCCSNKSITLYKGYPTGVFGEDWLHITFPESEIPLDGCQATFKLGGITKTFDNIAEGFTVNLTEQETGSLDIGLNYASLIIQDPESKKRPFTTALPISVEDWVEGDVELDGFDVTVNATLGGTTEFQIRIETTSAGQEIIEKIEEHNADETAHPYIQGLVQTEAERATLAENALVEADEQLQAQINTKQPKLTSANAGTDIEITEVEGVVKINSTAEGVTVHNELTGRDAANAHPISAISGLQDDLDTFYDHIDDKTNPHEVTKTQVGLGNVQDVDTTNASNITSGTLSNDRLGTIPYSKLSGVASSAQGAKADSALQGSDVINNTTSSTTNKPLSAAMGKSLQDQVNNLLGRGKYLSVWSCTSGLAKDNPPTNPYLYHSGDFFIVGEVGTTNYRPSGDRYTIGQASTVVETEDVKVNDTYYYSNVGWVLIKSPTASTVSFASLAGQPTDNTNLANALGAKQDEIDDLDEIREGAAAGATALQSGDNITELTNNAGFITSSYHDSTKQNTLVSGTNIKTINNTSVLGSGNIAVQPTLVSGTNIKTVNGSSILGSGNLQIQGELPSQIGNNGKQLTTNGTTASWGYTIILKDLED